MEKNACHASGLLLERVHPGGGGIVLILVGVVVLY